MPKHLIDIYYIEEKPARWVCSPAQDHEVRVDAGQVIYVTARRRRFDMAG